MKLSKLKISLSLLLTLLCLSCVKTEIEGSTEMMSAPPKPQKPIDTTIVTPPSDTARLPITFDPSVDDWDETTVEADA